MAISTTNNTLATGRAAQMAQLSPLAAKKTLDKQILQAALQPYLGVKDNPFQLLYKSAIENINQQLENELGPNALQFSIEEGVDVSPAATAERIVSFATGLYSTYSRLQPDADQATLLPRFMASISQGIDTGFAEANEILKGLEVLNGQVAADIDATYQLVQQGLSRFSESLQAL